MIHYLFELVIRYLHPQEALKALWSATYPGQELHGLVSDQWKEMGWQGRDPSTDFRLLLFFVNFCLVVYLWRPIFLGLFLIILSSLVEQRSWFHFLGELTVFCQDIFGKILVCHSMMMKFSFAGKKKIQACQSVLFLHEATTSAWSTIVNELQVFPLLCTLAHSS